jgi:regulatory factor X, other
MPSEEQSIASPMMASMNPMDFEGRVFMEPQNPSWAAGRRTPAKIYCQRIRFSTTPIMQHHEEGEITLPDISQFTPPKTDDDAANALYTLYLTHVTTLVDCVRFCKEKMFFRLFTQFQGTLTVPVQKLLVHPQIAPWVKECDYLMYQRMVKVIAPLTLQVMPPKVMKFLDTIAKLLDSHIAKTFAALPPHLQDAKLEPATVFSQLLERMLRANQAAHAASMVLTDDALRASMWAEYARFVQPKSLMNAFLPDCGYDEEVYRLLTFDVRSLLLPLPAAAVADAERGTHYEDAAAQQRGMAQPAAFELDRIGHFLETLRARFAAVPSRDLLGFVHGVTGHILRDVTMERGQSYNGWLITKCFVDELALWLAHAGGFLARTGPVPNGEQSSFEGGAVDMSAMMAAANGVHVGVVDGSRRASAALTNGGSHSSTGSGAEFDGAVFDARAEEQGLDDSGIGLSLDDRHDVKRPGATLAADLAALESMASAAAEL